MYRSSYTCETIDDRARKVSVSTRYSILWQPRVSVKNIRWRAQYSFVSVAWFTVLRLGTKKIQDKIQNAGSSIFIKTFHKKNRNSSYYDHRIQWWKRALQQICRAVTTLQICSIWKTMWYHSVIIHLVNKYSHASMAHWISFSLSLNGVFILARPLKTSVDGRV